MQVIDFKAEMRNIAAAAVQCSALGAQHVGSTTQTDTCFRLPDGRLIRRRAPREPVEWILYHRADALEPRVSSYTILSEEQARRRWGIASLSPWTTVIKNRSLWMLDNVRIHLDDVRGLGAFLELGAMVSAGRSVQACRRAAANLREQFAPILGEAVSASYAEMLREK